MTVMWAVEKLNIASTSCVQSSTYQRSCHHWVVDVLMSDVSKVETRRTIQAIGVLIVSFRDIIPNIVAFSGVLWLLWSSNGWCIIKVVLSIIVVFGRWWTVEIVSNILSIIWSETPHKRRYYVPYLWTKYYIVPCLRLNVYYYKYNRWTNSYPIKWRSGVKWRVPT